MSIFSLKIKNKKVKSAVCSAAPHTDVCPTVTASGKRKSLGSSRATPAREIRDVCGARDGSGNGGEEVPLSTRKRQRLDNTHALNGASV